MKQYKDTIIIVIHITLAMLTNCLRAQDTLNYTLQKCIDLALQHNLDVELAALEVQGSQYLLQQSRASALPYVSGYANQGISTGKSINPYTNSFINQDVNTGQYGLNAGLVLFNGLSILHTWQQNTYNYKATTLDYEQAKIDLRIQVTLAYLLVLSNKELLNQAQSQIQATQVQLDRLTVLLNNQAVSPSVLYDTRGQLANDQLILLNTRASLSASKLSLAQVLGIQFPPNATFDDTGVGLEITKPFMPHEEPFIPAREANAYRKISALKAWRAAQGQCMPTLTLNGSLGSNYSSAALLQKVSGINEIETGDYVMISGNSLPVLTNQYDYRNEKIAFGTQIENTFNTYVGVSLHIPLFNGLKTKTQIHLAALNWKQLEKKQTFTDVKYKTFIEQATNDLFTAFERYQILLYQVENYKESFRISTTKFDKGAISTYEFIQSKTNYEKAQASLISARYDYIFRTKILEFYSKN